MGLFTYHILHTCIDCISDSVGEIKMSSEEHLIKLKGEGMSFLKETWFFFKDAFLHLFKALKHFSEFALNTFQFLSLLYDERKKAKKEKKANIGVKQDESGKSDTTIPEIDDKV
jgi:hypothetical protein